MQKENRGITLVALVVTIIVLLILAGVSLSLVGGSNGILTRTTKSVDATELASFKEAKELSDAEVVMEMHMEGTGGSNLYDYIKQQCEKNPDKTYETGNGTYWIDDEGYLHFTDKATGNDSKLIKDKEGNTIIKEVTIDGNKQDMTDSSSLTTEIETAIDELLKEYYEKYGTSNQEKTFEEFIKEKCEESGKDYVETENGGKIYPTDDGKLIYSDSAGNNTTFVTKDNGEVAIKEMTTPSGEIKDMTTSETLKTEVEKAIEDLKKEHEQSGSDKTFEEFLKDKCEQNGGSISTSTGGTIASNGDGTFSYADGTEPSSIADFTVTEMGKVDIEKNEINKPENTGGTGGSTEKPLPNVDLVAGDITFEYSTTTWANSVTVTAKPNIDITGYTLQTSRNGVTWNNNASQTFTNNGTFYVRLYNGTKYGGAATANVTNVDGVKPVIGNITSNTSSITFTATDEVSGIIGYAVTESPNVPSNFETCENTKNLTQTVSGTQGTTYYIWVKDEAGNIREIKTVTLGNVQGLTTADINFTYSTTNWTNQTVTVTATPKVDITGYTMQVSLDGTNWTDGNSHEFTANGTLYVSLRDDAGQRAKTMASADMTKIDKTAPVFGTTTVTTNSFSFSVADNESGLAGWNVTETDAQPATFTAISGTSFETTVNNKKNNKPYYIWVKNVAGGVSKKAVNLNTVTAPTSSNLTATTSSWSGTNATVTFNTSTSFQIQYSTKQSTNDSDWTTGKTVTVATGTTVYARLWDGTNGSSNYISHRPVLTYTITYNGNGATGGSTAKSAHQYGTAKALTANGFSRTGYTFAGWNTAANGSGTNYSNGQSVNNLVSTNGGNLNLYAKWKAHTYTITYNGNGATGGSTAKSTHQYGTAKALTANGFSKTGYTFAGWNTAANGSGTNYSNGQSVNNLVSTNGGNLNLYAKWKANTYTINYNGNGSTSGSTASSSHTYGVGKNLTANGFTKNGYHFQGWATSSGGGKVYNNSQNVNNLSTGSTVTLYAVWQKHSFGNNDGICTICGKDENFLGTSNLGLINNWNFSVYRSQDSGFYSVVNDQSMHLKVPTPRMQCSRWSSPNIDGVEHWGNMCCITSKEKYLMDNIQSIVFRGQIYSNAGDLGFEQTNVSTWRIGLTQLATPVTLGNYLNHSYVFSEEERPAGTIHNISFTYDVSSITGYHYLKATMKHLCRAVDSNSSFMAISSWYPIYK